MTTKIVTVKCPFCDSENVSKNGHNKTGKQVYICKNSECKCYSFVEEYTYKACNPDIREQVLKMTVNGTGTRATGRILGISKDTVTAILKKQKTGHGK
jgi:transposase-like protein